MRKKILAVGIILTLIDQLVKVLLVNYLTNNGQIHVIDNFFSLAYIRNEGAAWGIFSGSRWFLIGISLLAIYAIIKYFLLDVKITKLESISYSMLIGGILGNLIDRIAYGYVIDYFSFTFGTYQFPVFNFADMLIVIGTILIISHLIRNAIKQRSNK